MPDRPRPTVENERIFLYHQRQAAAMLVEHPGYSTVPITIEYESPFKRNKKVTFKGLPKQVLDQIDIFRSQAIALMA